MTRVILLSWLYITASRSDENSKFRATVREKRSEEDEQKLERGSEMRRASGSREAKAVAAALLSLASSLPVSSAAPSPSSALSISRATPAVRRGETPMDGLVLLCVAAFHLRIVEFKAVRKVRSKRRPSREPGWCHSTQAGKEEKRSGALGEATVEESVHSSSSSCVTHCRESVRRPSSARKQACSRPGIRGARGYVSHPGIRRRAKAILEFLSSASSASSELHIRGVFGNSPDTSKALRILLRTEEIRRSGVGGRADPFLYTVAGLRSDVIST